MKTTNTPKQRPILFSGPMVRAILDGRKTQTRRIVKPQPRDGWSFSGDMGRITSSHPLKGRFGAFTRHGVGTDFIQRSIVPCPYGQPGDRLWLQESYRIRLVDESSQTVECRYEEDKSTRTVRLTQREWDKMKARKHNVTSEFGSLIPGRFMYRSLSRIVDEITTVRVERLQDITEQDAIAEGVEPLFSQQECDTTAGLIGTNARDHGFANYLWHGHIGKTITRTQSDKWDYQFSGYHSPRQSYSSLWESINGPGSWDANPWVWVVEFQQISKM